MSKRGRQSKTIEVWVDGFKVTAALRPPFMGRRKAWHVRWRMGGKYHSRSTHCVDEAKARAAAEDIVRGKSVVAEAPGQLCPDQFVEIQKMHFDQRSNKEAVMLTTKKFDGVWKDFLGFYEGSYRGTPPSI